MLVASVACAKDFKVATVDLQKLFKEYPGTKAAHDKLSTLAQKKEKELLPAKKELEDLDAELKNSASVLSSKQKKEKQYLLEKKYEDFKQQQTQVENDLAAKEADMTQGILGEIKTVVAEVAKDSGVDLILDADKTVYAKDSQDLTDAVMKKFKSAAPADSDK
jgi:outer membrane protein